MSRQEARETSDYYNVLADGKFHLTVDEGTEGAVLRKYDTSDGTTGEKWEKVYESLSGKITKVEFYDGKFGKNIILNMEDEIGAFAISLSTSSNFGEDMLKKILNINLAEEVKFTPFSFTDDKGKSRKGVSVVQGDAKITSYFHDYDEATKKTTVKNGYPKAPTKKVVSSDEWKLYFMTARLAMIDTVTEKLGIVAVEESDAVKNF